MYILVKSSCNTIIRVAPTDAHFPLDNDDGDGRPLSLERRILARNQKVFWVMEDRKGKGTAALRDILYVKFPHHSLIKLLARLLIYHSRYLVKSTCPSITTRPQWTFPPRLDVCSRPPWRVMPGGVHVSQCQTVATFYSNHFSALLPLALSLCGEVFRQRRMLWGNLCLPQRRPPPQYGSLMS